MAESFYLRVRRCVAEVPASWCATEMRTPSTSVLRTADALLAAIRARQDELGLSNEALEHLGDFAGGVVNKYIGPSREKCPSVLSLYRLLDALGLSVVLRVDPRKKAHLTAGRRKESSITDDGRISQQSLRKLKPLILTEAARKAVQAPWSRATPEQRREAAARMNAARLAKREMLAPDSAPTGQSRP
jgi:hypothetical protein